MAEIEEPQFTWLSQRIAALNQQQVGKPNAVSTTGKRPPPPPPNRPPLPLRGQTTNNPPISTYGSSVSKQANNQPIAAKNLLPPPPIDRDNPRNGTSTSPRLPARKHTSPALPPRNPSTELELRRGSNDSTTSNSTLSSISMGQNGSVSSTSSLEGRKLPPAFDQAKLPPLPPTRREKEAIVEKARSAKVPVVIVKSAPLLSNEFPTSDGCLPPKMPPRPSKSPRLPARPSRNNLRGDAQSDVVPRLPSRPSRSNLREDAGPALPVRPNLPTMPMRRLPPEAQSIIEMSSNNKPKQAPDPGPAVQELTMDTFESIVMAGKPALVDFYTTYCRYCVELEPVWQQLGQDFASDRLVIASVDVGKYKSFMQRFEIQGYPTILFFDGNCDIPEKYPYIRDYETISDFIEKKTGINVSDGARDSVPPPINLSSKPSTKQVKAVQARAATAPAPAAGCLICRDYSRPDQVATQYRRQSLPRTADITGYLADVLCSPFISETDKARAIFTWLHHNIAYDTVAFFGNNVKHVDPKDTIASGVAVCGGYAGVFSAIALKAGLEAVMVTGHGKGFGYAPLAPGSPIPPCNPAGHAWNAVRIDGGEWKLIDCCWGSGNVGNKVYNKKFTPSYFTMSNGNFGIKHFPADKRYFYHSDRRVPSWEEYIIGPAGSEPLQLYGCIGDHGLSGPSFLPAQKRIPIHTGEETVRFQFSKLCKLWDHERNGKGKPYCMILKINGINGRKEGFVPFEKNEYWWWVDVPRKELGAPGQGISVFAVTSLDGRDGRGVDREEYLRRKGRCGMGFEGIAKWMLV